MGKQIKTGNDSQFSEKNIFYDFLKTFKIFSLLWVFLPPIIFSSPFPPPPFHIKHFEAHLKKGEPLNVESIPVLANVDALGASLFSQLLNIKTESMLGYVCIENKSEVYFDDKKIDSSKDLLDGKEGGAMSVTGVYNGETYLIYIPIASTTCHHFGSGEKFAKLENKVEVRGILPYGRPELQTIDGQTTLKIPQYSKSSVEFKMEGEKGYEWEWKTYTKNFFLFLFAWIILLSSVLQVYKCVKKDS